MMFSSGFWGLSTPQLWLAVLLGAIAAGIVFFQVSGRLLWRAVPAALIGVAVEVVSPLLVAPAFLSAGPLPWSIALVGAAAFSATAFMHAMRSGLGCVLSTRLEWGLWMVALVLASLSAALVGASAWLLAAAVTFGGAYLLGMLLPSRVSSTSQHGELFKAASVVALPVLLTGVAWAGIPALVAAVVCAVVGYRHSEDTPRVKSARISIVLVHAISAFMPLVLLAFRVQPLPASLL